MQIYDGKNGKWWLRDTTPEEDAYLSAWQKVREWVRENCHFDGQFDYHMGDDTLFRVENGKASILKGAYGYDEWVDDHETNDKTDRSNFYSDDPESKPSLITMKMIRDVIDNWVVIKKAIVVKIGKVNDVFSFKA